MEKVGEKRKRKRTRGRKKRKKRKNIGKNRVRRKQLPFRQQWAPLPIIIILLRILSVQVRAGIIFLWRVVNVLWCIWWQLNTACFKESTKTGTRTAVKKCIALNKSEHRKKSLVYCLLWTVWFWNLKVHPFSHYAGNQLLSPSHRYSEITEPNQLAVLLKSGSLNSIKHSSPGSFWLIFSATFLHSCTHIIMHK